MILEVIVNISNSDVDRTFDYEGDDVPIGSRVVVEFGKKRLIGFVIGKKEKSEFSGNRLTIPIFMCIIRVQGCVDIGQRPPLVKNNRPTLW